MRLPRILVTVLTAALVAAACSSGDDSPAASSEPTDDAGIRAPGDVSSTEQSDAPAAVESGAAAQPTPQTPSDVVFADHGVAGWTDAREQATSTFQTDADVASYRLASAWLEHHGTLPPAEAIRAEEWINALDHDYPDPPDGETFAVFSDLGEVWWQSPPGEPQDTRLLRVGVQATRQAQRAPASITFVVDTSGSMATESRLETLVDVLGDFVDTLQPRDQVAVVEFDTGAATAIEHTSDPSAVRDALAGLTPGGSTNTAAGVLLGHELAADAHREGDNSTVVLVADGMANEGITDPDRIVEEIGHLDAPARIVTHTVGIGLEVYNDALLEAVANDSGGTYAYVDGRGDVERVLTRDLPVLTPVAHDVKAQVVFDPDVVSGWRLVGYENRLIDEDDFRDDDIVGGHVGAGHAVTALYELRLDTEGGTDTTGPLGTATVRWADPDTGEVSETDADLGRDGTESATFGVAAAMAALTESLRDSSHAVVDLDTVADRLAELRGQHADELERLVRDAAGATRAGSGTR